jgi:hypothetical protein
LEKLQPAQSFSAFAQMISVTTEMQAAMRKKYLSHGSGVAGM